jgi:hypothetical protein
MAEANTRPEIIAEKLNRSVNAIKARAYSPPSLLAALDGWITKQEVPLTRPEAIRAMMETILHILSKDSGEKPVKKAKIR